MGFKKACLVLMGTPLMVACDNRLSSLHIAKIDRSSMTTAGTWVSAPLRTQLDEGQVIRCGEILEQTPKAFKISNENEVAVVLPAGTSLDASVGVLSEDKHSPVFTVQTPMSLWSMSVENNELTLTYAQGNKLQSVTYKRSTDEQAQQALTQHFDCTEKLMADVDSGKPVASDVDRENRAVLAKHRITMAMVDTTDITKTDVALGMGYFIGTYATTSFYDYINRNIARVTANSKRAVTLINKQVLNPSEKAAAKMDPDVVAKRRNIYKFVTHMDIESLKQIANEQENKKIDFVSQQVTHNMKEVRKMQVAKGVTLAASIVLGLLSVRQFVYGLFAQSPRDYVLSRPELANLIELSDHDFRGLVAVDPAQGELVTNAYNEISGQ